MSLHKEFTNCAKLADEKKCSWIRTNNIDQRCTSYTFEKKNICSIERWFFSYEERYTYF